METGGGYSKMASRLESLQNKTVVGCYNRAGCGPMKTEGGMSAHRRAIADLEISINQLKLTSDYEVVQRICQLLCQHGHDLETHDRELWWKVAAVATVLVAALIFDGLTLGIAICIGVFIAVGEFWCRNHKLGKSYNFCKMDVTRYKMLFGVETEHPITKRRERIQERNSLEDKFNVLNYNLGEVFRKKKKRYLLLRCCLFEHIDLQVLGNTNCIAKDLFDELDDKEYVTPTDVSLLLEVAELSELKDAKDVVKRYMEDNNVQNTDQQQLTPHRKRLCRALTQFDPNELHRVNAFYSLELPTIWDILFELESKEQLEDESERKKFAELLGPKPQKILYE